MSFHRTIRKLHDGQNFVGLLHSRMKQLRREFKINLEYNDQVARQIAQKWRGILGSKFDFEEAEFDLLIDEVVGELVCIIATTENLIRPISPIPRDPLVRAFLAYGSEYIALDVAVEILCRVFKGTMTLTRPTPQRILEAALTLRQQPQYAHRYWTWLGLQFYEP
jgi:hypothetical protein